MDDVRLLLVAEVADKLRVSRRTVYAMVERGELSAVRVGPQIRVRECDLVKLLGLAPVSIRTGSPMSGVVPTGRGA